MSLRKQWGIIIEVNDLRSEDSPNGGFNINAWAPGGNQIACTWAETFGTALRGVASDIIERFEKQDGA